MTVWNRLGKAVNAGLQAGLLALKGAHQLPFHETGADWDDWQARINRYQQLEFYYTNTQHSAINLLALKLRESGNLYVNVRSIYNPVHRLVNLYADKVYPGVLDLVNLDTGALPVVANDTVRKSLIQLLRWSNWNEEKQVYVRKGEKYADVFLKVVNDVESRRVAIEILDPQKVRYVRKGIGGNIKEIWIEYMYTPDDRPLMAGYHVEATKVVRVTEIITGDKVRIFEDSVEVDSWDNPFGFVPVVHAKATSEGQLFGTVRWNTPLSKIDEINSQASLLNDQVRKAIIPYIATIGGALKEGALTRSSKTMDEIINIAVGIGGDVKAISPNIDIASALNNIQNQLDELREDLPELFLYQLTDMTVPPSGVALRQFFDLAVNKIESAQGIYDDPFIRACQMAMTVAGVLGYDGFPYDINSFDRGELNFSIKPRNVIYDAIPEATRILYLQNSGAPKSAIWTALQVSPEDQEKWKQELEDERVDDEPPQVQPETSPNENIQPITA